MLDEWKSTLLLIIHAKEYKEAEFMKALQIKYLIEILQYIIIMIQQNLDCSI